MPDIVKIDILGNENIGLFAVCKDSILFLPHGVKPNILDTIRNVLNISKIFEVSIADTSLIGMFSVINRNGLVLPKVTSSIERKVFSEITDELGINVEIIDSKITALGNTILATDKIAIISPEFEVNAIKQIEETLDVEVIPHNLVDSPLVGSVAFTNGKGTLLHPLASEEDLQFIKETLKTDADITTVNRGVPYPHSGIIANTSGAVVGSSTTGPETLRIFQVIF